jgi:predicted acyltransferase
MYHGEGVAFDPEGLLSTLPAIVNVIAGYAAGLFLQRGGKNYETIAKLMMIGAALLLMAAWWDLLFPINKKLWTSTYVLHTVGLDLIILSILVFIIEIAQQNKWTSFFEVFGKNTLFIYLLSEVYSSLCYSRFGLAKIRCIVGSTKIFLNPGLEITMAPYFLRCGLS